MPNLKKGDLVLLRCKETPRNEWLLARISKTYDSADGKVRKVEVMTAKRGSKQFYTRPVTEIILLKTEGFFGFFHQGLSIFRLTHCLPALLCSSLVRAIFSYLIRWISQPWGMSGSSSVVHSQVCYTVYK